jgi:hypothetical protein
MLFGETVAVYYEKHTEHTDTLCGQNVEIVPHRKHFYVSTTESKRLMLFGETVGLYCENYTKHTDTLCVQNIEIVPHRNQITSPIQTQQVNALWRESHCLLWEPYGTQIHCMGIIQSL